MHCSGTFLLLLSNLWAGGEATPKPALDRLWLDLSDDAACARAVLHFASRPGEAIEFFKARLRPVKDDPERVAQLIGELSNEKFPVREKATGELEFYGKYIKERLQKALAEKPAAEASKRLKQLLDKIPNPDAKPKPPPMLPPPGAPLRVASIGGKVYINGRALADYMAPPAAAGPPPVPAAWVRSARAVALLEHFNTPDARALLQRLADGEADALPTVEARAALERLRK